MLKSLFVGITRAGRNWKMILLLLVANLLVTLPVAAPLFLLIIQTTNGTPAADKMLADKLELNWFTDLFNNQFPGASIESAGVQFIVLLAVMGLIYLLLNTFFAGGILEVFASDDSRFSMRRFWAGCGAFFWRFFRLMLISLIFYGLAGLIFFLLNRQVERATDVATAFEATVYRKWAILLVLILLCGFVNMVFDYARIRTVLNDSRKMWRETFGSLRFAGRRIFAAGGLYFLIAIIGLALFAGLSFLRSSIDQSTGVAVLLAIVTGQLAIASRIWTRLSFYAAELNLYRRFVPGEENRQD